MHRTLEKNIFSHVKKGEKIDTKLIQQLMRDFHS